VCFKALEIKLLTILLKIVEGIKISLGNPGSIHILMALLHILANFS